MPISPSTAATAPVALIVRCRPQARSTSRDSACSAAMCRPATPSRLASSKSLGVRGSSGLWCGWPKPCTERFAARSRSAMSRARASTPSGAASISSISAEQPSIVPMKVLPTPSSPAATADCSASGAAS
jgi:hypothetical protein